MNTGQGRAALMLAVLLLGTAGCGGGGGTPTSKGSTGPTGSAITIRNFAFKLAGPVAAGSRVTVTNTDRAEHSVTADRGPAFNVEISGSGGTGAFTAPSKPGSYAFHCKYHSNMHGALTVR